MTPRSACAPVDECVRAVQDPLRAEVPCLALPDCPAASARHLPPPPHRPSSGQWATAGKGVAGAASSDAGPVNSPKPSRLTEPFGGFRYSSIAAPNRASATGAPRRAPS
jgi:hypothetical protein